MLMKRIFRILSIVAVALILLPSAAQGHNQIIVVRSEVGPNSMKYSIGGGRIKRLKDDVGHRSLDHNYSGEVKVGETITIRFAALHGIDSPAGTEASIALNPMSSKFRVEGQQKDMTTPDAKSLPSGHLSYTVEPGVEKIQAYVSFTSYFWTAGGSYPYTVSMWINYTVVEKYSDDPDLKTAKDNERKFNSITEDTKLGDGIGDDDSDGDGSAHHEEDNEASVLQDVVPYLIPAAVIAAITGIVIKTGGKKGGKKGGKDNNKDNSSKDDKKQEEEEQASYAMNLYKDFGDTLIPGDPPRQVFAQIVKTVKGVDTPDAQLTSMIQIKSGSYLEVAPTGLTNGWKTASVAAPNQGEIPEEGIVVFSLAGGNGSYTNRIHFRIQQEKMIVFMQKNITFIAGERKKETMTFRVFGIGDNPEFSVEVSGDKKSGIEVSAVAPDRNGSWCFDIEDTKATTDDRVPGDLDRYVCTVTAKTRLQDGSEKTVSESFEIFRFYEGIRLDVGHIKAYAVLKGTEGSWQTHEYPTDVDQSIAPAHTRVAITLFALDKEKNCIGSPVPDNYRLTVKDVPDSVQFYGKQGARIDNPVEQLGFKIKKLFAGNDRKEGCISFEIVPQAIMLAPNRSKATVTAECQYGGKTYRAERTVMVLSMPYRTPEEIDNAYVTDEPITQKLNHMKSWLLARKSAQEMLPLISRIGLVLNSYDKHFGYFIPDVANVSRVFMKFARGEVGAIYANEHAVSDWEIADDTFERTIRDYEKYIPENLIFRIVLAAGIVVAVNVGTGGTASFATLASSAMIPDFVYYTPKEFLVTCRDYANNTEHTGFWDHFLVGAAYGAREYIWNEASAWTLKSVVIPGAKAAWPGVKEMASEFGESVSKTAKQICDKFSTLGYARRVDGAVRKVQSLINNGRLDGKIKLDAAEIAVETDPNLKAWNALNKEAQEEAETLVKDFSKACKSETISEAALRDYVIEIKMNRHAKNYMNSSAVPNEIRYRYTTESKILTERTKIEFKKQVAKELGCHESDITFFEATGHSQVNSAVSKQKVSMDYDFSPNYKGKDLPESYAQRVWNDLYYQQGTGKAAPSTAVADEFGKLTEQTAVHELGAESYAKDLPGVLNPEKMAAEAWKDVARVERVTVHKILEPLKEAVELAEKAMSITDSVTQKSMRKRALGCIYEFGRNVPKAMPRTMNAKLEQVFIMNKGNMLDGAKLDSLYKMNGLMSEMMSRAVERDSSALVKMIASYKMEGKNPFTEVEKAFSMITDIDNIIKNG